MRGIRHSLIAAIAIVSAGCGILPTNPDAGMPVEDLVTDPRPAQNSSALVPAVGPVIEIASGTVTGARFAVVAYQSVRGACIGTKWANAEGMACGPEPGAPDGQSPSFGVISEDGDGVIRMIAGVVDAEVDGVAVELPSGERIDARVLSLEDARMEHHAFIVLVPQDQPVTAVLALDPDGEVTERFEIGAGVHDGQLGPDPTPAAS